MDLVADITLKRRSFDLRVELSAGPGTLALVGPSGAGKTSLLRALAGLEQPAAGRVALGEELWTDVQAGVHVRPERRRLGYLPQDYALFPHLTVAGNVRFAGGRERPDLLRRLGIDHLANARPSQLSGGERQRVGLARALARDPQLLLLDEPFAALDAITREQVRDELGDLLQKLGLPTLLVTHAFEDAAALAERIGVLDQGRIVQLGTPRALLDSPATSLVARLTGANTVAGTAEPVPGGSLIRLDGGGQLTSATTASGRVEVVLHPWTIELADPAASPLTDVVLSVRPDRDSLIVRLTRLTVRVPAHDGQAPVAEGTSVGLRVAPDRVRVIAANASRRT